MSKDLTAQDPLTMRERIALAVLLAIIKLMKPADWSHHVDAMTKQIEQEAGFKVSRE